MSDDYEIECVCEPDEGEPWEIICDEWRTAKRRGHKCCECGETVQAGQRYRYTAGKLEGDWASYKRCEFCENEAQRILHDRGWPVMYTDLACCLVAEIRGELR